MLLANAVTCAVLGSAGPQRSRILGLLSKDDRPQRSGNYPWLSVACQCVAEYVHREASFKRRIGNLREHSSRSPKSYHWPRMDDSGESCHRA